MRSPNSRREGTSSDVPCLTREEFLLLRACAELASGTRRRYRISSAASSTGQEPYSLSMTVLEYLRSHAPDDDPGAFEILGTDISSSALFIAIAGTYDQFAMKKFSLLESFECLGRFDLVLCRNVLVYFSTDLSNATSASG